ncbi:MAG: glycerol kinase GlpK [Anaerohalosphaeraceae bacterium]
MKKDYLLAIDQGTSATKAVVFDTDGRIAAKGSEPLGSSYPRPGFVEQDPLEIYRNVLAAVQSCLAQFRAEVCSDLSRIRTCGISNQRETFCLWDAQGRPLCPAVVWQCKRSAEICSRIRGSSLEQEIIRRTGLIADPYFSGTKLVWLMENRPDIRTAVQGGRAFFGTVDTWLLYKLTGGRSYCTDYTNASRTLFFDIDRLCWDPYLLGQFHLTGLKLPEVRPSSFAFGQTDFEGLLPAPIGIHAMVGDSHAAAFGERCFTAGTAKATLGTGCSILLNTGSRRVPSSDGMMSTICWSTGERVDYALEGIIVSCGATIQWLRDNLGLLRESEESEAMARSVPNSGGVYLIPAFSGLGAPYWNMDVRAAITGLTLGSTKNHLVRAALESIPYQIQDVIAAMEQCSGLSLAQLRVDGGISKNRFILQFLADLLGKDVINIGFQDVSAFGAACLAGLGAGIFEDLERLPQQTLGEVRYQARADTSEVQTSYQGWLLEVERLNRAAAVRKTDRESRQKKQPPLRIAEIAGKKDEAFARKER